jgi:hypothetical protein
VTRLRLVTRLEHVDESSGRRHADLDSSLKIPNLLLLGHAAVDAAVLCEGEVGSVHDDLASKEDRQSEKRRPKLKLTLIDDERPNFVASS